MPANVDSRMIIFLMNYCYSVFKNVMNEIYLQIGALFKTKNGYNFQARVWTCFSDDYNYSVSVGEAGA